MPLVIIVTGTPGTGKTAIAKLLARHINGIYLSLNEIAKKYSDFTSFDIRRGSWVINEKKLTEHVVQVIREVKHNTLIIDTHFGDIIPNEYISFIIILRTHPLELERRLKKRNWPNEKIRENVEAEILGTITYDILQNFSHEKIFEIDTTKATPEEVVEIIKTLMSKSDKLRGKYQVGLIDWLNDDSISLFF